MPVIHFLNVNKGDCSIIEHYSKRITVIDVCNASKPTPIQLQVEDLQAMASKVLEKGINGNFNQKAYPHNPITYMQKHGYSSVFRFIATHPDMDHLDGIADFFEAFSPANFWDTDNKEEKEFGDGDNGGYDEDDWKFYKRLRDGKPETDPKRLTLHSDASGPYYNEDENGKSGGDGLQILAPTPELVTQACECEDYNDCSYVILYTTDKRRILFAGDSHDATWEHILGKHKDLVTDVDLLIAPHHGRHSDRDWEFLDVVNPALTFFGNAKSEHLAYQAWSNRGLPVVTNNQAGSMIVDSGDTKFDLYVTCEAYAKKINPYTFYSDRLQAYYWGAIRRTPSAIAKSVGR